MGPDAKKLTAKTLGSRMGIGLEGGIEHFESATDRRVNLPHQGKR